MLFIFPYFSEILRVQASKYTKNIYYYAIRTSKRGNYCIFWSLSLIFCISKIYHEKPNYVVIHKCTLAHYWNAVTVQLQMIYFWYSECKSSYIVYSINFIFLFVVIELLKKELVSHCGMLNDIFNYDHFGTVMSQWNKVFISLGEISVFISLGNLYISPPSV